MSEDTISRNGNMIDAHKYETQYIRTIDESECEECGEVCPMHVYGVPAPGVYWKECPACGHHEER